MSLDGKLGPSVAVNSNNLKLITTLILMSLNATSYYFTIHSKFVMYSKKFSLYSQLLPQEEYAYVYSLLLPSSAPVPAHAWDEMTLDRDNSGRPAKHSEKYFLAPINHRNQK